MSFSQQSQKKLFHSKSNVRWMSDYHVASKHQLARGQIHMQLVYRYSGIWQHPSMAEVWYISHTDKFLVYYNLGRIYDFKKKKRQKMNI